MGGGGPILEGKGIIVLLPEMSGVTWHLRGQEEKGPRMKLPRSRRRGQGMRGQGSEWEVEPVPSAQWGAMIRPYKDPLTAYGAVWG